MAGRIHRLLLILGGLLVARPALAEEAPRLVVPDFEVHATSPLLSGLGKGLAGILVYDISQSLLAGRVERRMPAGTPVEATASEPCLMVAGKAVIESSRIDVTVSIFALGRETAAFEKTFTGSSDRYRSLLADAACAVIAYAGHPVPDSLRRKAMDDSARPIMAAARYAAALEARDRLEPLRAWREAVATDAIDPRLEPNAELLRSLNIRTSLFAEPGGSVFAARNPAWLGIIRTDILDAPRFSRTNGDNALYPDSPALDHQAAHLCLSTGYALPVGDVFGLGLELSFVTSRDEAIIEAAGADSLVQILNFCGTFGAGWLIGDWISVGAAITIPVTYSLLSIDTALSGEHSNTTLLTNAAVSLGFVLKDPSSFILYEARGDAFPVDIDRIDPDTGEAAGRARRPVRLSQALTVNLLDRRLLLFASQVNSVGFDREFYFGSISIGLEIWPFDWLGLRAAGEGALGILEGRTRTGLGGKIGITARIPTPGGGAWYFSAACLWQPRPSEVLGGTMATQQGFDLSLTKTGAFFTR